MNEHLTVEKAHHVDEGDPGPDGLLDYRYAYWVYEFRLGSTQLRARRYDDTPEVASIVARGPTPYGPWTGFAEIPYAEPIFRAAISHLVEHENVSRIDILLHGEYVPVDRKRALQ